MFRNKRHIVIGLLLTYLLFQILWWAYSLIELYMQNAQLLELGAEIQAKKVAMVIGEGVVFVIIMSIGGYMVSKGIQQELRVKSIQNNFLLAITHELKTPIASLKLLVQTFQRRQLDEAKQETLRGQMDQQLNRLNKLVNQLLLSTKVDNKDFSFHRLPTDFTPFFALRLQEAYGGQNASRIESGGPDVRLNIDKEVVWLCLSNLIDNALKYSEKNKPVEVRWNASANHFLCSVRDYGKGIPKAEAPYIFDRFFRGGKEEKREATGTGIGLYLSKKLIDLHGGRIQYHRKDTGSEFTLTLPL